MLEKLLLAAGMSLLAPAGAGQTTWYVDVGGSPPGSGTANAPYTSIQYAIEQRTTVSGDTILVLPGTYVEYVDFRGKALDVCSSRGPEDTTIRSPDAMDAVVLMVSGEGSGTRLAGFTVTGGGPHYSTGGLPSGGCGIYCTSHFAKVEDCVITANGFLPFEHGGGVLGVPHLLDCKVSDNVADVGGGGAFLGTVERCVFERNFAYAGGGIFEADEIIDSVLAENVTPHRGGGVFLQNDSLIRGSLFAGNIVTPIGQDGGGLMVRGGTVLVEDTVFAQNVGRRGGGAHVEGATVTFARCTFHSNQVQVDWGSGGTSHGGGLYVAAGASVSLLRSVFRGNRADAGSVGAGGFGGAVWGSPLLVGCTLANNEAALGGGGVQGDGSAAAILRNGIAWGNLPDQLDSTAVATYSDVEGGWPGTGNIALDPLFFAPGASDYHLRPGSPAIDAGDPTDPLDPDGSRADMGAYPFEASHCTEPAAYCDAKTDSGGCTPSVAWTGSATLTAADDFVITASNLLNRKPGMLFYGLAEHDLPFKGGTLCVKPPVSRTTVRFSGGSAPPAVDCSGTFAVHFPQALMVSQGLPAYTPVFAQIGYRDPGDAHGVGLSDALVFVVCP